MDQKSLRSAMLHFAGIGRTKSVGGKSHSTRLEIHFSRYQTCYYVEVSHVWVRCFEVCRIHWWECEVRSAACD